MGAREIPITLLKAEYEPLGMSRRFRNRDLLADVLEAGQDIFDLNPIHFTNRVGQLGRNDGGHCKRVFRHGTVCHPVLTDIVKQKCSDVVSGQQMVSVLRLYCDTHPIAVRIGCEKQIGAGLFGELQALLQCLLDFGIGERAGREIAIRHLLLGDDSNIRHADLLEYPANRLIARAVKRRIDQLQARLCTDARIDLLSQRRLNETVNQFVGDIGNTSIRKSLLEGDSFDPIEIVKRIDFCKHRIRCNFSKLSAVASINLVTVVFCGIVGGCNHNPRLAMQLTGCKRKGRDRHQFLVDMYLDPICREHPCRLFREQVGLDPAVVRDCNCRVFKFLVQIVGESLSRTPDGVNVHPVGPCADNTAQSSGSKSQVSVKPLKNFFILPFDRFQLYRQVSILKVGSQPALIQIVMVHKLPLQ